MQQHILQELGVLKDFNIGRALAKEEIAEIHKVAKVGASSKKEFDERVNAALEEIAREAAKSPEKIPGLLAKENAERAVANHERQLSHTELSGLRDDVFYFADELLKNYSDRMDIAAFVSMLSTRAGITDEEYRGIDWKRYDFSSLDPYVKPQDDDDDDDE